MKKFVWTDAIESALRSFWDEGLTAKAIGQIIGTTRAAVLGKVRRMGLPMRIIPTTKPPALPRSTLPSVLAKPSNNIEPLFNLNRGDCKFPIGHPGDEDFKFCSEPSDGRHPYCSAHAQVAYTTSKPIKFRDMKK